MIVNSMERINTRKRNTINKVHCWKCYDSLHIIEMSQIYWYVQWFLTFYLLVKRLMITKNSVVKIQKLIVSHESRPAKSNPANINKLCRLPPSKNWNILNSSFGKVSPRGWWKCKIPQDLIKLLPIPTKLVI